MQCPTDSSEMKPENRTYFTSIRPDETLTCPQCERTVMLFRMLAGPSPEHLVVWRDEIPAGISFSEFIEDKMGEWLRRKMH